ncbi:MAG: hypothetical protein BRD29_03355, partial [Bacteroidetes bacterium QH_2_67_10]
MSVTSSRPVREPVAADFPSFIDDFRERLRHVFRTRADADEVSTTRGLEPFMMREVQRTNRKVVTIVDPHV